MRLVAPALLALLTMGWQKALAVALGMFLTNLVSANVLNPILMKKSVNVSFLEMVLSLIVWGTLLGPVGTVVAIPLTLVLKRVFERSSTEVETPAMAPG
jgi:AI-2 transport protein TqsA